MLPAVLTSHVGPVATDLMTSSHVPVTGVPTGTTHGKKIFLQHEDTTLVIITGFVTCKEHTCPVHLTCNTNIPYTLYINLPPDRHLYSSPAICGEQ